jgi:hypothetical protein
MRGITNQKIIVKRRICRYPRIPVNPPGDSLEILHIPILILGNVKKKEKYKK